MWRLAFFGVLALICMSKVAADSWAHVAPSLNATCRSSDYDIKVTFPQPPSGFKQFNDIRIAAGAGNCSVVDVSVETDAIETEITETSYGTSQAPGCGSGASYATQNAAKIEYKTSVRVTIKQEKGQMKRYYNYDFNVVCTLTRSNGVTVTSQQTFTVDNTQAETDAVEKPETFSLPLSLNFLDDDGNNQPGHFTAANNDLLKVIIQESPADSHLKFTVQRCYVSNRKSPTAIDATTADIITAECNIDDTVIITPGDVADQAKFEFETRAFTLVSADSGDKFCLHCEIFVCFADETNDDQDGKCKQDSAQECSGKLGNGRRRRDVGDDKDEKARMEIVSSKQTVVLSDNMFSAQCPRGFIFDRSSNKCTQQRLIMVKGVQLKGQWVSAYGNSSSSEFRSFAISTEHQLHALMTATGAHNQISGMAVTEARQGSLPGRIIIDLLIHHAEDVQPDAAFVTLKDVLYNTPQRVTRLVNLVNVDRQQVVELVHVSSGDMSGLNFNVVIIVIVVVVIAVVLVCGFVSFQMVKKRRSPTQETNGVDNVAMEKA